MIIIALKSMTIVDKEIAEIYQTLKEQLEYDTKNKKNKKQKDTQKHEIPLKPKKKRKYI